MQRINFKNIFWIPLLGAIVYFNSLWVNFIWDDYALIINNHLIKSFSQVPNVFSSNLSFNRSIFYRPLQNISYMIDFSIFKLNPWGFHLTNIALHILAVVLLYKLLLLITSNSRLSLFSSLLYLVSPLWVETVTYVAGRADILMAIFIFSALIAFLKERYFLAAFFYILALFSKEASLVYPLIIVFYCWIFKSFRGKQITHIIVASILSSFYIIVSFFIKGAAAILPQTFSFPQRLLFLPKAIMQYVGLIFFPLDLHMSYTVALPKNIFDPRVAIALIFCAAIIFLFFIFLRRARLISFFIAWFFIMLLPYSGLFAINAFFADHFIYLAAPGIFVIFVYFLQKIKPQALARTVIFSYLAVFSIATIKYNFIWQDPVKFYTRIIHLSKNSFAAYNNLGVILLERGDFVAAESNFEAALKIDPNFQDAKLNLARCYYLKNDLHRAIGLAEAVVKQSPNNFLAFDFLGTFYLKAGNLSSAEDCYKKAVTLNARYAPLWLDLYSLYRLQGRTEDALKVRERIRAIDKNSLAQTYFLDAQEALASDDLNDSLQAIGYALRLSPENSAYANLKGHILRKQGDLVGAFFEFKKAIKLSPKNWEAYNNLGNLFAQAGDFASARKNFEAAISIKEDFADAYFNLGLAYFEEKNLSEAKRFFQKTLAINNSHTLAKEFLAKIK
ncbi:MAG: tetratricopeptide repeat protein [Candidatus Omnitrophica bacterium]|nr:tetratricopeptide repeat protein [Candidatus Omnitrophota bacterium]MDD5653455.1 tetratricopeptide repeat protein [Candidatus Omnitrophota bacterium]